MEKTLNEITCPGCGLLMPESKSLTYDGYYNVSPECWSVYTEVLEAEFSNMVLFGQVHQLTVDSYAVQNAGGIHKAKSVMVNLARLHLVYEKGIKPSQVSKLHQRMAHKMAVYPEFTPPENTGPITVFDIATASDQFEHEKRVKAWSEQLWNAWSHVHKDIEELVNKYIF